MISAKTSLSRAALRGGAATFAIALLSVSVAAQAQTTTAAAAVDEGLDDGTIVVTGTLLKNPNLVLSSPVSVVSAKEIQARQINNAEQLLRDLPGVVVAVGNNVNNGANGAAFVNLRGLGSNRNLALIDGDRIVPAGSGGQFDLNNVPVALIQRVDVLTGGASTTYGADAVSGVVNFITKQDFTGIDLQMTSGINEVGDGQSYRFDLTVGGNFDDGRGNATLSVGYQRSDAVSQGNRDISIFQVNSRNGRAAGGSPTSTPTTFFFTDTQAEGLQNNATGTAFVPANPDGFNFAPFNYFRTPYERFNIFAQAKYEIFDGIEVYSRGLFSKNVVETAFAPSGIFADPQDVNINNPFISPAQRDTICGANPTLDCSPGSTEVFTIPAVYRRLTELGPRTSEYTTTVFDYKAGVRGDITSSIGFDVFAAYGESSIREIIGGYTLNARIGQALLSDDGVTCRVTTNNCVPLNLFGGAGTITPDMVNFIAGGGFINTDTSLTQVRGVINGDLGVGIPFASSPINFAVGVEYRDYGYDLQPDGPNQVAGALGGRGGRVVPFSGGYSVVEGFAEFNIPVVDGRPGFESLSIDGGVRQSQYSIRAPGSPSYGATTWKVGASWVPVTGFKVRGGYNRAVRAPNIGELFTPLNTGLTNLETDPCSGTKAQGNANLAAVCIAQGANAAQIAAGSIGDPAAGQANSTFGGNPNLLPEIADTFTVGGVLTPTFAPGLVLTVDYFNIVVNDAITNPTPSDVIDACFANITAASAADPACTGIRRNPTSGRLSGPTATVGGLPQPLSNLGRIKTSGIDFTAAYTRDVGFANLGLNFTGTYTFENKFQATPTSINRECIGQYSVNCSTQPKFQFNQRTTLDFNTWNVSLLWRHIDPVRYETLLTPIFVGTITGSGPLVGDQVDFNRIRAYDYLDLGFGFNITDNLTLNLLVANLLNEAPPNVGSTAGSTSFNSGNTFPSNYDALGRRYSATLGVRF